MLALVWVRELSSRNPGTLVLRISSFKLKRCFLFQTYGKRASISSVWEDPLDFVVESWPWSEASASDLTAITAKDVGFDVASSDEGHTPGGNGPDPLFNMLMQLQEAAATNNESASGGDSSSGP